VVCGLWFVVCGLWFVVCGLWFVVCGLWFVVCGLVIMFVIFCNQKNNYLAIAGDNPNSHQTHKKIL
jgi:hypothetical protein